MKKIKNNKNIDESEYKYLDDSVTIDVVKVDKNSFDIVLPDGEIVTIKNKEAEQIFNTLNKIKAKESEN